MRAGEEHKPYDPAHEMSLSNAVINYGEFCGNNGYQLPGHGPVCAAAASIVKSDDGVYDPEDRIDAEELMFQEEQEDQPDP